MISDERLEEIARLESDFIAFPPPHSECSDMAKELLALRKGLGIPDGWKLVPIEPTAEMMLHNSSCQHHAWDDQECSVRQLRRNVWGNMIAAAPAPGGEHA